MVSPPVRTGFDSFWRTGFEDRRATIRVLVSRHAPTRVGRAEMGKTPSDTEGDPLGGTTAW